VAWRRDDFLSVGVAMRHYDKVGSQAKLLSESWVSSPICSRRLFG